MDKEKELVLNYLKSLKEKKEIELETGDFSKVESVKYGLSTGIRSLENVIEMLEV